MHLCMHLYLHASELAHGLEHADLLMHVYLRTSELVNVLRYAHVCICLSLCTSDFVRGLECPYSRISVRLGVYTYEA